MRHILDDFLGPPHKTYDDHDEFLARIFSIGEPGTSYVYFKGARYEESRARHAAISFLFERYLLGDYYVSERALMDHLHDLALLASGARAKNLFKGTPLRGRLILYSRGVIQLNLPRPVRTAVATVNRKTFELVEEEFGFLSSVDYYDEFVSSGDAPDPLEFRRRRPARRHHITRRHTQRF